jgi:hypothetical protein
MDRISSPRQRLEQFRQSLTQPDGSGQIRQEGEKGQVVIWSSGQDGKASNVSLPQKIQGSASRHAVRQQVKQLLRENHIQITADIKKVLPSRLTPGNAARLCELISPNAMPLQVQDLASLEPHLHPELAKLKTESRVGNGMSIADYLIKDRGPVRNALVALIQPALAEQADNIASDAFLSFTTSLVLGRSIDQASDCAFQDVSESYAKLKPGKTLVDVANCIAGLLKEGMKEDSSNVKIPNAQAGFAQSEINSIMPALMIAAFIPALAQELDARTKQFHDMVNEFCSVRGAEQAAEDLGYEQQTKAEVDAAELWRLHPSVIADRLATKIYTSLN